MTHGTVLVIDVDSQNAWSSTAGAKMKTTVPYEDDKQRSSNGPPAKAGLVQDSVKLAKVYVAFCAHREQELVVVAEELYSESCRELAEVLEKQQRLLLTVDFAGSTLRNH